MTSDLRWLGWAIDRPGQPLFVQYDGDEADAWRVALGWPSEEEIAHAKANGARAFRVEIREYQAASPQATKRSRVYLGDPSGAWE